MKKLNFSLLIFFIFTIFGSSLVLATPIYVKDYIADKFPTTFNLYLSSLEELDEAEKEFIDLLEKLSAEEQTSYAKKVYKNGFSSQMTTEIKKILQKEDSKEYVLDVFYWGMNMKGAEKLLQGKSFGQMEVRHRDVVTVKGKGSVFEVIFNAVTYEENISNVNLTIMLEFYKDELIQISCLFPDEDHKNLNDYIKDYENLKKYLIEKYDDPTEEGIEWKKDKYRNEPDKWGLAVSKGDLHYFSIWDTSKTTVIQELGGWKGKISFTPAVVFRSKRYKEIGKEIIELSNN